MIAHPFGVYIHVPFCRTLCTYCSFARSPLSGPIPESFIQALCREILQYDGPDTAQSLFFGGGTPSLLSHRDLDVLFYALHKQFSFSDPEISLEVNADDVTHEKVKAWQSVGINRVSIGVQSLNDEALRYLGRRHDAAGAWTALDLVGSHFDNWGMDLIYGIPVPGNWEQTLEAAVPLHPPHVSTYALTYAPNTPLWDMADARLDDDAVLQEYQAAESAFAAHDHYEVSNFAMTGRQCRHNLLYWHNEDHAGFGPAAYSLTRSIRASNPVDLSEYIAHPGEKSEALALTRHDQQVETLIQHFRLKSGIQETYYAKRFGESVWMGFGRAIEALIARNLLYRQAGRIAPTPEGFYLNDEIGLALVG